MTKLSSLSASVSKKEVFQKPSSAKSPSSISPKTLLTPLSDYGHVIGLIPEIQKKYQGFPAEEHYKQLSPQGRVPVDAAREVVTPSELKVMWKQKILGFAEEASDMFFEVLTLKALKGGGKQAILTPELINTYRAKFLPKARGEQANERTLSEKVGRFDAFLSNLKKAFSKEQVTRFQNMIGLNLEKSTHVLSLMTAKFIFMMDRNPAMKLWKETQPLLKSEARELQELLPRTGWSRWKVALLSFIYTRFSFLPLQWFAKPITRIVGKELRIFAPWKTLYTKLIDLVCQKQEQRQRLTYEKPELTSNQERKKILKGFEILYEAAWVKKMLLWFLPRQRTEIT